MIPVPISPDPCRCARPLLVLLILLALAFRPALATTYYISPNGNDANSGTSAQAPWQTLAKASNASFVPGDTLLLQGGMLFSGSLSFEYGYGPGSLGTPQKPITIGSYGTGRATIQAGEGTGVSLYNTAGFVIEDLIVEGAWSATTQSGNSGAGISAYTDRPGGVKLDTLTITNCDISGFKNAGIVFGAYPADGSKSGFKNVRITDCTVHDNGHEGILSYGYFDVNSTLYAHANIYVGHCLVDYNRGVSGYTNNTGNGIVLGDVADATIERCVAHHNGDLGTFPGAGPVGIMIYDSNDVALQFNEAYANSNPFVDGDGFDLDGGMTNSVMQYNYSHDNGGAGFLFAEYSGARPYGHNSARFNISQNDGRLVGAGGITFWNGGSGITDCEAFNNTVFASPGPSGHMPAAVFFLTPTTNVHLRNNLLVTTGGAPLIVVPGGQVGIQFQGNDYWAMNRNALFQWSGTTYASLTGWRKATGQETIAGKPVGLSVDPLLVAPGRGGTLNNADALTTLLPYRLTRQSPLPFAGLPLPIALGSFDFYQTPLRSRPIGACQ